MSATAAVGVAEDDGRHEPAPGAPRPGKVSFVDSLVARLHAEYGVDGEEIRRLAAEALETFATARVQAFVPVLVEKSVRVTCRRLRDARTSPSVTELDGGPDAWAVAAPRRR